MSGNLRQGSGNGADEGESHGRRTIAAAGLKGAGLACLRGERMVFSGLDFRVRQGGALVLRGANGSGKTSFLRLVAGLLPAFAGSLTWRGRAVRDDREAWHRALRLVGHLDAVKPLLTVVGNVAFRAGLAGGAGDPAAAARRVAGALEAFGLDSLADAPARFLSAGQRRRVALAGLLAAPAPVWLLDEPAASLDDRTAAMLGAAMAEHRAAGGLVVAATHVDLGLPGAETLTLGP